MDAGPGAQPLILGHGRLGEPEAVAHRATSRPPATSDEAAGGALDAAVELARGHVAHPEVLVADAAPDHVEADPGEVLDPGLGRRRRGAASRSGESRSGRAYSSVDRGVQAVADLVVAHRVRRVRGADQLVEASPSRR